MEISLKSSKFKQVFDIIYIPLLAIIFASFWIYNYSNKENIQTLENIEIITIGSIAFLVLLFFKDTFYITPIIIFTPFIYARSFYINGTPVSLIIACGIAVIGLLLHLLLYKVKKITKGKLFFGLTFLMIAIIFGGITLDNQDKLKQIGIMASIAIAFIFLYVSLVSTIENTSFDKVAIIMSFLGLMIVVQSFVFYLSQDNIALSFDSKILDLGWGCSNNCAMMYLLTLPFSIYLVATKKNIIRSFFGIISFFEGILLIFTYSRGGIISYIGLIILMIIAVLVFSENKITPIMTILSSGIVFGTLIFLLILINKETYERIITTITNADFDNLNGRGDIYLRVFESFKQYPIFGKGLLTSSTMTENGVEDYLWAHGTIFQTIESFGLFGLIALCFHFIEKYANLFKEINLKKGIVLCSFLGSGFYGLFDISYYYINYMVVIIFIFIFMDKTLEEDDIEIDYLVLDKQDKLNSKYKETIIDSVYKEEFSNKNKKYYEYYILRNKYKK